MKKIRRAAGLLLAAVMLAACMAVPALALSPVPDEPVPPAPDHGVTGTPLVGVELSRLDSLAAGAGYRRVSDVYGDVCRKYVKVDEAWTVTCVAVTPRFVYMSTYSLVSDFPGAICGYPVAVSNGMVLSERDFATEWFGMEDEVIPDPPAPDPAEPACAPD